MTINEDDVFEVKEIEQFGIWRILTLEDGTKLSIDLLSNAFTWLFPLTWQTTTTTGRLVNKKEFEDGTLTNLSDLHNFNVKLGLLLSIAIFFWTAFNLLVAVVVALMVGAIAAGIYLYWNKKFQQRFNQQFSRCQKVFVRLQPKQSFWETDMFKYQLGLSLIEFILITRLIPNHVVTFTFCLTVVACVTFITFAFVKLPLAKNVWVYRRK
ncbi:hypothetical protein [Furfurilactobacillus entadae]|uniref:hypothetical protein n=1 Tax=Furfurilactobacillus entadae TaxID=2922307 RepID=UPI0035E4BD6A